MGRQKGDPNRSRTRPSSSSLAASLLQTSNTRSIGFGGYIGSAQLEPTHVSEKGRLGDIAGEAALHFRRLSKKDPTTKLKALEGIGTFIKECTVDEISQLLPHWIIQYKCLVVDSSRQVRESTNDVMAEFAAAAGRELAPHLRAFMGAWWVSQFDPTSNVSEVAKGSFQVAFPDPIKRTEALRFTAENIFMYLDDSLKSTPQSISDKSLPMDEALERLELVLSSCLLAFATLLDILLVASGSDTGNLNSKSCAQSNTIVRERAAKLCISHNFFKDFTRSKTPQVRSAAYQALRSLIQNLSEDFVSENLRPVASSILESFGEKDPSCHTAMWDMVLLLVKRFPQAWKFVQVKKVILSRLWALLRHGCYGSGRVSYPCLLPLVSLIPADTVEPTVGFFSDFFCNLWKGHIFYLFTVQDTDALIKAFKECFLWIMNNTTRHYMDGMRADQIQDLLLDVLLNLLWHTYVFGGKSFQNSKNQDGFATCEKHPKQNLGDSSTVHEQIHKGAEKFEGKDKLPDQFIAALRVSIIELLDAISAKDLNFLRKVWSILEDDCIHLITNEAMSGEKLSSFVNDCVYRISHFFSKLAQVLCKGEQMQWFLGWMATSFVAKLFPTVSSLEFSLGIDLLSTIVSTCGPMSFGSLKVPADSMNMEEWDKEIYDITRDVFKNKVIPWCLGAKGDSTLSKINLLLSFFENESFRSEWCHAITFATMVTVDENGNTVLENEKISILATLIESFRQKYVQLEEKGDPSNSIQLLQQWEMSDLEAAILTMAGSETLASPACLPLLRNSLGGEERHSPSLLSVKTTELVLDWLLRRMLLAVTVSGVPWAVYAASLILQSNESAQSDPCQKGSSLESARVALQAIGNSIYCLASVDLAGCHDIVARVLATIFFIDWLYNMPRVRASLEEKDRMDAEDAENGDFIFGNESVNVSFTGSDESGSYLDDYSTAITETKAEKHLLMVVLKSIFGKTNSSFFRSLTKQTRVLLCQTLIQCVKFIVLENTGDPYDIAVICAEWIMDVLKYTCHEKEEIDHMLDLLFEQNTHWPFWTTLCCSQKGLAEIGKQNPSQMEEEKHARFVSFIDRIIFALGWDTIFADFVPLYSNDNEKEMEFEDWQALVADCDSSYRVCILIELLCTWNWPGGNAMHSMLPFLQSCALQAVGNRGRYLVEAILHSLFVAAVTRNNGSVGDQQNFWMCVNQNVGMISEPYLRALLVLINGLLQPAGYWGKLDAMRLYKELILEQNLSGNNTLEIAPFIVTVLSPTLRRQELCTCNEVENDFIMEGLSSFQESACHWLQVALSGPPLSSCPSGSVHEKSVQMAVSHFPFHPAGGATTIAKAASANISIEEKKWLLKLLRKQSSREAIAAYHAHAAESRALQEDSHKFNFPDKTTELTLAKLVVTVSAYCWEDFEVEDWKFVISLLHKWLDAAVIDIEETTEAIADAVREEDNHPEENNILIDSIISKIVHLVSLPRIKRIEPTLTALDIFSLIQSLENKDATEASAFRGHLGEINWKKAEVKATENILRLFFATGFAESIAVDSIAGEGAGKIYSFSRKHCTHLWERIAEIAVNVSDDVKKAAADSIDIWGIGRGAIRALYALLLTPFPIPALQWAAYRFLLSGPFQESAVVQEDPFLYKKEQVDQIEEVIERSSSLMLKLRSELSSILDISPSKLFESQLTSSVRVCYLLGWAIFLTRLNSFLGDLAAGESLIQYLQDSSSPSTLLDFLFHYIPVKSESKSSGTRGKGLAAQDKTDNVAAAASRAAASGFISFAIEGLWPVDKDSISILAGAVYGLILRVLPAHARVWFTSLRDRSTASAIEAFTMANCSPQLLMDEYSEVQHSVITDESLTVKANHSTREITASYKKEEAGMDMIIKLPACYPLRPVEVDCTKCLGISENRLRKWIFSMAAFLRNQNGAVARAIQIWKQNVDREFDGVEECPICYSIIHTINHSLPRLACKTCKHKFHGACLYKWFSTSHKSTCPLCQTPF